LQTLRLISAWPTSKIFAACSQIATGTFTTTIAITASADPIVSTVVKNFETVVVIQTTCTAAAPRLTAPSHTKICGGDRLGPNGARSSRPDMDILRQLYPCYYVCCEGIWKLCFHY
jgi:hypothetical protein